MKIIGGKLPTDAQLMSNELGHAFFSSSSLTGGIQNIPMDEWPTEIQRMHDEEDLWWQGDLVDARLVVELPFWLMTPDGELQITHEETTLPITVRGDFVEVYHGPSFLNSHANVAFVGPHESLLQVDLDSVVPNKMPVFRNMKTVAIFNVKVMKDAFEALASRLTVVTEDRPQVRRFNRATQYFQSLVFGHIPFLNKLITSYRSVSLDPWAFEVSECDVSVWYVQHASDLVRIGLMPYWDRDSIPSVILDGEESPFFAAASEHVQAQIKTGVAPGKLELLDALSLSYRGRFEDAVRSAVTAIEVALEAQLKQLLLEKGCSEDEANARLAATRNSFFERLTEYEKTSKRRIPGPVLSFIPYINGIRLRNELESARTLRHKVVHEGTRIDLFSRGPMLRVVETMTWIFEWLTANDMHSPASTRNYAFFTMLRGQRRYPFEYAEEGVCVLPRPSIVGDSQISTAQESHQRQYDQSVSVEHGDIELFARMTFLRLGLECIEGPPPEQDSPIMQPRFLIRDKQRQAIVFCSVMDGELDFAMAHQIATAAFAYTHESRENWTPICILQHQQHLAPELRETSGAVPAPVVQLFRACGITVMTTVDLQLLANGLQQYGWSQDELQHLLFVPGRQGISPPFYRKIGVLNQLYPKAAAMSIHLDANATLKMGDTLGFRLATRYHEQTITSIQVDKVSVNEAHGPGKVGVATMLSQADMKRVINIYKREFLSENSNDEGGR